MRLNYAPSLVNVYIDGYNFYYAILQRGPALLKFGWCDFSVLARRLTANVFPDASVGVVKYFTASVGDFGIRCGEADRQRLWLKALRFGSRNPVHVIKGFHAKSEGKPRVEKQTDTKLAISIVRDSLMSDANDRHALFTADPYSRCDGVILISADRDLTPALEIAEHYGVNVSIVRPNEIAEDDLFHSMLPDVIEGAGETVTWQKYMELKTASDRTTDHECLRQCRLEAAKSHDPETQVGSVILHPRRGIIGRGHNRLPDRVERTPERVSGPLKRDWMEHAERNAISDAAKQQIGTGGCTLYVDLMPCADCARGIVQAGLAEVVISRERKRVYKGSYYAESQRIATLLLEEAGVTIREV